MLLIYQEEEVKRKHIIFVKSKPTFLDREKKALGELKVIEIILNAMNKHINDVCVCEKGCGALSNITKNGKHQFKYSLIVRAITNNS